MFTVRLCSGRIAVSHYPVLETKLFLLRSHSAIQFWVNCPIRTTFLVQLLEGLRLLPNLDANETRVIGCLIEKSILTPDLYPLTLNALVSACNQKSGRSPVIKLQSGEVQHTIRVLEAKHFVRTEENFKSRAEKYLQRFCNTRYSDYQFEPPQLAIVCLLLLRGPQTPGELRARSGRLFAFEDNAAVVAALDSLIETENEPLLVKLPRTPGRKDSEYMHLFSGPVDIEAHISQAKTAAPTERTNMAELAQRVSDLEAEVARLKELLT
jgi:uncharacterized protein YceH (UPF0502 family)